MPKVSASKLMSAFLAVAVVVALLAALMVDRFSPKRAVLRQFDVQAVEYVVAPDGSPAEPAQADTSLPPTDAPRPVSPEAVRVEEMVNYFRYALPRAEGDAPLAITADVARTPWNDRTLLLRVALAAREVPAAARPPANLAFLVDVSGSMADPNRLDLVKSALATLADQVRPQNRVPVVTYADGTGVALAYAQARRGTALSEAASTGSCSRPAAASTSA